MARDLQDSSNSEQVLEGNKKETEIPSGRVFQWPVIAPMQNVPQDIIPLPGPNVSPTLINLSGLAAEDITVDRIQRSFRVALDWPEILTTVFDYTKGTGFEHVRRPLERAMRLELDINDNPTQKSIQELAVNLNFIPGATKTQFNLKHWRVLAKKDKAFDANDFHDTDSYLLMWKEKVDRLDLIIDTMSSVDIWDLYAIDLAVRYEQIKAEINATSIFIAKADELLAKAVLDNGLDNSYRTSLRRAMDMKVAYQEARAQMRELQQKAESLGYRVDPETGKIVKLTNIGTNFIPSHHSAKLEPVDELGIGKTEFRLTNARPNRFKPIPDWVQSEYTLEEALSQSVGLRNGLFDRKGGHYVAATGHKLDDVLAHLDPVEFDPMFNKISIPVYDMGVNTGERLARVITASRPHIGRMPIRLPELFIEEKYRMVLRWSGVSVGEVIESITLAPSEERTLVMERSTMVERETRVSATSSLDITREARSELISELEAESRRSRDSSHSSNWSASASGGADFGMFNASGSASGGQTWNESTNEFAKKLSKLTQKAASSLTARTRYEISTMANFKATSTTRESTTINLKNINQGCALTLFLHQLTNRYAQELRLTELTVTVLPSAETLFASEFALPRQFPLSNVSDILKAMTPEALPVGYPHGKKISLSSYYKSILNGMVESLRQYQLEVDGDTKQAETLLDEIQDETDITKAIDLAETNFKRLAVGKANLLRGDNEVDGPCAGLLMSTMPSPSNALEEYTNNLRHAELERRHAENKEILARARQLEAIADSISLQPSELVAIVRPGGDLKEAIVNFFGAVRAGTWDLLIDGVLQKTFDVTDTSVREYKLVFMTDQLWLAPTNMNVGTLLHRDSKLSLPFVV